MALDLKSPIVDATERYFARVDETLSTLSAAKARAFLAEQIERWTQELVTFIDAVDRDRPIPARFAGAHVTDFHCTIARLSALQANYRETVAA